MYYITVIFTLIAQRYVFLKIKNVGKIKKTFINVYYNYALDFSSLSLFFSYIRIEVGPSGNSAIRSSDQN